MGSREVGVDISEKRRCSEARGALRLGFREVTGRRSGRSVGRSRHASRGRRSQEQIHAADAEAVRDGDADAGLLDCTTSNAAPRGFPLI